MKDMKEVNIKELLFDIKNENTRLFATLEAIILDLAEQVKKLQEKNETVKG